MNRRIPNGTYGGVEGGLITRPSDRLQFTGKLQGFSPYHVFYLYGKIMYNYEQENAFEFELIRRRDRGEWSVYGQYED